MAIALLVPSVVLIMFLLHRWVHHGRVGLTPLAAYTGAWLAVIALYAWNPIELIDLSPLTWLLLGLGGVMFATGYALAVISPARTVNTAPLAPSACLQMSNPTAMFRLWVVLLVGASVLFAIFARDLAGRYGLNFGTLLSLREDLGQGSVPAGFYFYLFAEPLVLLSVVLAIVDSRRRKIYLVVAVAAVSCLLTTSGRSNATYAVLWSFCAFVIYLGPRLARLKTLAIAAAVGLLAFGIFGVMANTIGKTYEHSATFARYGSDPPVPAPVVGPYLYVTGALPTFSEVVSHADGFAYGRYTFRPIFQILAVVDHDVEVPQHIQAFELIPYPFNVSTYLSSFYRDLGVAGVIIGSFLTGVLVGLLYLSWQRRPSPATLCLAGFGTVVAISSVGDLQLLDLSRVVELLSIVALSIVEARAARHASRNNDGRVGAAWPST